MLFRSQALKQFELCRDTLAEQLGVQPERATLVLFRRLREERIVGKPPAEGQSDTGGVDLASAAEFPEVASPSWHDSELAVADKPTVVILPFDSVTGDGEVSYLSVGFAENIITGLSKFKELLVVALKSSIIAGNAGAGIQDLGRYLGVTHVVEGTVARLGDRVRVTTRYGKVTVKARLTDEVRQDCLRMRHGWEAANVNELTGLAPLDPLSGFPWCRALPVRVVKLES